MDNTINYLREIELQADINKAAELFHLLSSESWAIKAKVLITIGRLGNPDVANQLIEWLKEQAEVSWQLQTLDSWYQLPLSKESQAEVLIELLGWAKQPITIRGLISLSGYIGGEKILRMLVDFISKPSHRLIKDEILADAWFRVACGMDDDLRTKLIADNADFRVWLKHQTYDEKSIYGIYPNPDYLWQQAKAAGLSQQGFKSLYLRSRKKSGKRI